MRRASALLLLGIACCTKSTPPAPKVRRYDFSGRTMGTTYLVKVISSEAAAANLRGDIEEILSRMTQIFSTYEPDSELSQFNRHRGSDWFPVSRHLAAVVALALQISKESGGAFDVTVAVLVNLWGFGPEKRSRRIPAPSEIKKRLASVGYRHLQVRLKPPSLRKDIPSLACDLSAIAKGYAVDQIAEFLTRCGFHRYMVEIGGEVRACGTNERNLPWRIGVQEPDQPQALEAVIELREGAVATSGDYYNYFEYGGVRYSHTIDPRTGRPVRHTAASVTVVRPTCAEADGLATAIEVLGPEEGLRFAEERKLPVLLLLRKEGRFVRRMTPLFERYLAAVPK